MPRSITIPAVDDATATWLTDPTQRAFVVQLHAETGMAQGEGRGRVEHEGAVFALLGLLVAFTFWHWRLCCRA